MKIAAMGLKEPTPI